MVLASTQAQEVFEDLGGLGRPWLCEWRGLGGSASSTDSSGLWGAGGGTVGSGCVCSVFLSSSSFKPTLGRGSAAHMDVAEVPVSRS